MSSIFYHFLGDERHFPTPHKFFNNGTESSFYALEALHHHNAVERVRLVEITTSSSSSSSSDNTHVIVVDSAVTTSGIPMLFGDNNKTNRSKPTTSECILIVAASFVVFLAKTTLSTTTLALPRCNPVEAFVPPGVSLTRIRRRRRPSFSISVPNMVIRGDDDAGDDRGRSQQEPQKREKHPRPREAMTDAAPMYITIGKTIAADTLFLSLCVCSFLCLCVIVIHASSSMMIERVPEWSSPHIAKCGFVVPKGITSWISAAASNYTR